MSCFLRNFYKGGYRISVDLSDIKYITNGFSPHTGWKSRETGCTPPSKLPSWIILGRKAAILFCGRNITITPCLHDIFLPTCSKIQFHYLLVNNYRNNCIILQQRRSARPNLLKFIMKECSTEFYSAILQFWSKSVQCGMSDPAFAHMILVRYGND